MSTKIYNGYKINNLSAKELKDFVDELKAKFEKMYKEKFVNTLCLNMVSFLDNLTKLDEEYKNTKDSSKIEKELIELHQKQIPTERVVNMHLMNKYSIPTIEEVLKDFDGYLGSCIGCFYQEVSNISIGRDIARMPNPISFNCDMCIYPLEDKILLQAFGDLDTYFQNICYSRKKVDKEFCKKYGLVFYGYWNNTEKPNNVTKKEWDIRCIEWNQVLKGIGIPIENGLLLTIVHREPFIDNLMLGLINKNKTLFKKMIPSFEDRVNVVAETIVKSKYVNEKMEEKNLDKSDYFEICEISGEFKKKIQEKDSTLLEEISKKELELKDVLKPINIDTLINSIFDYCPNYYKDKVKN